MSPPRRRRVWLRRIGIGVLVAVLLLAVAALSPPGRDLITRTLALRDGAAGYLYGYPLVTMVATSEALTRPPAAPNTFVHTRFLPTGDELNVVRPSRDLLYSSAWLDLSDGPQVIHQPDVGDRFFLLPVLDAWTNVIASPGTRTTGNRAHDFLVAGPGWQGEPPPGMQVVRSPTDLAWVIGRIEVTGPADVPAAGRIQDGFTVTPLSRWPQGPPAGPVVVTAVRPVANIRAAVDGMDAQTFFAALADALATQPPLPADGPVLEQLARTGLVPGQAYDLAAQPPPVQAGLEAAVRRVQEGMTDAYLTGAGSAQSNGWRIPPPILGDYGTAYDVRAVVAREGLGANLPADAVYATATTDTAGEPLDGAQHYVIRFPPGGLPPVRAFWSVTAYDGRGALVPDPPGALSLSSHDPLTPAADGGLELHVGAPGPAGGPFLGTPRGAFSLVLRLYWPQAQVLDGTWAYPTISRVGG